MRALRYCAGKVPMGLIPISWCRWWARVMEYGARKYEKGNYRKGAPSSEQMDSLLRHLEMVQQAVETGDLTALFDAESWLPHVGHIQFNAASLGDSIRREFELEEDYKGNPSVEIDRVGYLKKMEEYFGTAAAENSWIIPKLSVEELAAWNRRREPDATAEGAAT